ncbi:MAG TPA: M23 family metallopeptidase, partial [Usitatibacter sp.]|nr:M23 family metallopeptidase [Usitatibacter sp.]
MSYLAAIGRGILPLLLFAAFAGLSFSLAVELKNSPGIVTAAFAPPGPRGSAPGPAKRPAETSVPEQAGLKDSPHLLIPVLGVDRARIRDNFEERRGGRRHEALDIMAARGTPVVAVDDGRVAKLFTSAAGGLTVYQFDPEEMFAYYYAHLDRYGESLREGMTLKRGDLVGYVGSTG